MNKKRIALFIVLIISITGIISFFGIIKPEPMEPIKKEKAVTYKDINIAFVNEDVGFNYDGNETKVGQVLINKFIENGKYQAETVGRNIAERGLEDGTYHLMVILPSRFSEDSLGLEKTHPKQAVFQYKIKANKQLLIKQAEQAVNEIKTVFNNNIIDIYFTSIINTLQNSQLKVSEVVERERDVILTFEKNLVNPLSNYSDRFDGISRNSENLLTTYSVFNREVDSTSDAFKSIADVDKDYEPEIRSIEEMQRNWQESVNTREEALREYDSYFSTISLVDELSRLMDTQEYLKKELEKPLAYLDKIDKVKELNEEIDTTKAEILEMDEEELSITVKDLEDTMVSNVNKKIDEVPYYSDESIQNMDISDEDKKHIRNINSFIKWYSEEHNEDLPEIQESVNEDLQLKELKEFILEDLEKARAINIPSMEGDIASIEFEVPKPYAFSKVIINSESKSPKSNAFEVDELKIEEPLDIEYSLYIKEDEEIDLLAPIQVKTKIKTKEVIGVAVEKNLKDKGNDEDNEEKSPEINDLAYGREERDFYRNYEISDLIFSYGDYDGASKDSKILEDIKSYIKLSSIVEMVYGIDLFTEEIDQSSFSATEDSLISLIDLDIKDDRFARLEELNRNLKNLEDYSKELKDTTLDLINETDGIIEESISVQELLLNKPEFVGRESRDNEDIVTVSLDINRDLVTLMSASQTLLNSTRQNQDAAERINLGFEELNNQVKDLEGEGVALSKRVEDLKTVMDSEYNSNEEFLKAFDNVLSNTKVGNSRNNAVFDYLSNPVSLSNLDTLLASPEKESSPKYQDTRTSLIIVLIMYMISIVIAYSMRNIDFYGMNQKRYKDRTSIKNSIVPLGFLSAISIGTGALIGIITAYKLEIGFGKAFGLVLIILATMLLFSLFNNFLLKKFKVTGMMVIMGVFLLYIISASQLFDIAYSTSNQFISSISPLTYVEDMIDGYIIGSSKWIINFVFIVIIMLITLSINAVSYKSLEEQG